MGGSDQFAARSNGTAGSSAASPLSIQRRKSSVFRRLAVATGKFAAVLVTGLVVGGAVTFRVTETEAATFNRRGGVQSPIVSTSDRLNAIDAWRMDIYTNGGVGIVAGSLAAAIMGALVYSPESVTEDETALKRELFAAQLTELVGQTSDAKVLEALATIQAEVNDA